LFDPSPLFFASPAQGKIVVGSPLSDLLATKGITPDNSNQFSGTANW
jgi:hypothetical protein